MEKLVIYRETKPMLGDLRPVILGQAQQLLKLRLEMIGNEPENRKYLLSVREFITGFDDSCGSAVIGITYNEDGNEEMLLFKDWIFANLFDRELYLLPGTWDLKYRGETTLQNFERDFRMHQRIPAVDYSEISPVRNEEEEGKGASTVSDITIKSSLPFRESFVMLIAGGYTSDYKKPEDLFRIIEAGSVKHPPPFEAEMMVANGKGIAGDVLIFYFENTYSGEPENFGNYDFHQEFLQNWLNKIVSVKSPDYIIEYYGPRNHQIEKYWPEINILLKRRLLPESPEMTVQATDNVKATAEEETVLTGTPAISKEESYGSDQIVETIEEIPGYPLAFRLDSLEIKQSYQYSEGTGEKELTASSDYRILLADISIQNKSKHFMRFSSAQFSLLNKSGKKVNARLFGVGDSVAESGTTTSIETKISGPDEKPVVTYWGKLNESVSYLEWVLSPGKSYSDKWVYLIPAAETDITIQFANSHEPLEKAGVSPLTINFKSQEFSQSYQYSQYTSAGPSQIEITASPDYRFFKVLFSLDNNTDAPLSCSSGNFSVVDIAGKKVNASFYGMGTFIVREGQITSFSKDMIGSSISGVLSTSVSYLEWVIEPHKNAGGTLVYLVPSNAGEVRLYFDFCQGDGTHYRLTSSGSSGCFIASAAFSVTSPEVMLLRAYRDHVLNRSIAGKAIVDLYYRISPPLARWISNSDKRKQYARLFLKPMLSIARNTLDKLGFEKSRDDRTVAWIV